MPYIFVQFIYDRLSRDAKLVSSLLPNMAMGYGCQIIAQFEGKGKNANICFFVHDILLYTMSVGHFGASFLATFLESLPFTMGRGVTRLDGARGKKQVRRPRVRT